jgi:hypothetical protein
MIAVEKRLRQILRAVKALHNRGDGIRRRHGRQEHRTDELMPTGYYIGEDAKLAIVL